MSAKYTFLAWETPIENAPLKLALLQLANNSDDHGFSYYSISKMAKSCGMSDRTFMRKIAELEKMNTLKVERRANRPSLYSLIGDEMGVTLCHLRKSEVTESHLGVTESHLGVTESHAQGDRESHDPNSVPNTYPNSNPNSLIVPPEEKRGKYTDEDYRLAEWMHEKIKVIIPSAKEPNFKTWADAIRLMRERDDRTIRQIAELFDWANKDSFWCTNILSPKTLRDKWNQLEGKRIIKTGSNGGSQQMSKAAEQTFKNLEDGF